MSAMGAALRRQMDARGSLTAAGAPVDRQAYARALGRMVRVRVACGQTGQVMRWRTPEALDRLAVWALDEAGRR